MRARAESVVSPLSLSLASPLASGLFGAEKVVGVSGTEFRWGVLEDRMGRHRAMQTKKKPRKPEGLRGRKVKRDYLAPAGTANLTPLAYLVAHA